MLFTRDYQAAGRREEVAARSGGMSEVGCPVLMLQGYLMRNLPLVVIVDDDESVRESLPDLVRELGCAARAFASAEEFLGSDAVLHAKCLILDIGLPGMSGPDLQRELIRRGYTTPTIFITGRSDRSIPPGLLQEERIARLIKPFSEKDLQAALDAALREDS